ncbi:MAG: SDR family oxidoreductase [Actinomycetota bacterium]|nr:SDR family oxidoreductase [Actinomycetota bacterium]
MGRFDHKVALVTGAGRGIGREEAMLLAREGARVVVNDMGGAADGSGTDAGPAQQVVDEIVADGGEAVANVDDISTWAGAEALVGQAFDHFGRLDVVVNNAGILRDRLSFNMTEQEWDSVIAVHLKGHFAVARHAAARWRAQVKESGEPAGAAIVNTASESGLYGNAGQANYAAAKAGIASLTLVMARELERLGVRVNAIAPVARTRLTEAVAGDYMQPDESGFDRFDPANVAAVACWLASDDADGITGQVVKVQGGQLQLLEGWRPLTEVTDDKPWTIESVNGLRGAILGTTAGAMPPFFFASPPPDRTPYPAA